MIENYQINFSLKYINVIKENKKERKYKNK